ncbi:hypothetical protein CDD83_10164 [Cordyceps sp. RAO-2017]|nr:hypothetical protein CDD83_10164 [Cordyceps sp. RAO-2017]
MGKKRRGHPDVEDVLARPWCYYCERDFEDLKLLISHQKAKHFKCDRCGRRLNTAGGLSVHMNQVHKETLHQVENALNNRQGLDVEIFGMEGIPHDILEQHRNRIIQNFYQAQEDRRIATGNPLPGQATHNPKKKIKMETKEELLVRVREWRAKKKAEREAVASGGDDGAAAANANVAPEQLSGQYQQPQQGFEQASYAGQAAHGQPPYGYHANSLPARPPGSVGAPPGLPQRLTEGTDRNVAAGAQAAATGDDIDKMIRMAEAGVKSTQKAEDGGDGEKKSKKGRLVYDDAEVSPEEKMAAMPRYAFHPDIAAA